MNVPFFWFVSDDDEEDGDEEETEESSDEEEEDGPGLAGKFNIFIVKIYLSGYRDVKNDPDIPISPGFFTNFR